MYCARCGAHLADSEKFCPLCGLEAYHPQLSGKKPEGEYPPYQYPEREVSRFGIRLIVLACFVIPLLAVLVCDLPLHGTITWSGYVMGALTVLYTIAMLPLWFKKPNPVIFVPIDFAVVCLYLLYINYAMDGDWFLSLALPVTVYLSLVVTAVITLYRYVRRGRLYICGGATIALGVFIPVLELLVGITFDNLRFMGWSFLPMSVIVLFGGFLIFLGICRPAREVMERKFFI